MTTTPVRIVVAGTAGGVGTTTVAALLFEALRRASTTGAPVPMRCAAGSTPSPPPVDVLVLVVPATRGGLDDADTVLATADRRFGTTAVTRTLVVVNTPFDADVPRSALDDLRARHGHSSVLRLPGDVALAVGGRVPTARLSAGTRRALAELDRRVVGVLGTQRRG